MDRKQIGGISKTMKLNEAKNRAKQEAIKGNLEIAVVKEGPHADEFAERDQDGESYGYCPVLAIAILYRYGQVIETVNP